MRKDKLMLIGIDGATFDIILPMVGRGELPHIASVMRRGVWGDLSSTIPSVTIPAWISCLSGMNPGKLGLFYLTRDFHATYDEGPPSDPRMLTIKLLWHHVSDHDRKVVCVLPFRFPPARVNGVMLTDMDDLEVSGLTSHSPEIAETLVAAIKPLVENRTILDQSPGRRSRKEYLEEVIAIANRTTDKMKEASLYLLRRYPWDLFVTVFKAPDAIQHYFWACMDPSHPLHDPDMREAYGEVIHNTYRRVDAAIGEILSMAGGATVVIVSDHGFGPIHKVFYANKWLQRHGFLTVKGNRRRPTLRMVWSPVRRLCERLGLNGDRLPDLTIPTPRRTSLPIPQEVAWNRTKAYATVFGMNINLKGREPKGIVSSEEYHALCECLRARLYELTDPGTGERIVDKVYRKEEIYSGTYVDQAPDIVYLFKGPHYYTKKDLFASSLFAGISLNEKITAHHINYSASGIFLAAGPEIIPGTAAQGVQITDVTPTVLYLLGLPIPRNLDGSVLSGVLAEGTIARRPPIYGGSENLQESGQAMTPEEEERVKDQLRRLGYIG